MGKGQRFRQEATQGMAEVTLCVQPEEEEIEERPPRGLQLPPKGKQRDRH